jgi:hypothetical protein
MRVGAAKILSGLTETAVRRCRCTLESGRRSLLNRLVNEMRRVSAASVDSQFPVDPRCAGPRAG